MEKCSRSLTYFSPKRTFRKWTWAIPCFDTLTVDVGGYSVRVDVSRKCGGGVPRIPHFAELGPGIGDATATPRSLPVLTRSPSRLVCDWCVETQAEWDAAADCLALRISPNWVLELAYASSRSKDTGIKYCHRTGLPLVGAWRPEPSGIRRQTASHCVYVN